MTKIGGLILTICLLQACVGMAQTSPTAPSNDLQSKMHLGPIRILFGGEGVDFTPYLNEVESTVRQKWYQHIPAEALPPQSAKGEVAKSPFHEVIGAKTSNGPVIRADPW